MHNNALADPTLMAKYSLHQTICLSSADVNEYGLLVRHAAKNVWERLNMIIKN